MSFKREGQIIPITFDNFLEVSPDDGLYSFTGFYSKFGRDRDCTDVTVFNNY